jgi:rfaE bifunctional protein kinase chain/domain
VDGLGSTDAILGALARQRVLVVGDVFLDEYVFGHATRLSREAPIPVLEFLRQTHLPGGAANPAHNIAALGARAVLGGVVGDDAQGRLLLDLLHSLDVAPDCVLADPARPTTVKTRIVSEGLLRFSQQLARIDRIDRTPIGEEVATELLRKIEQTSARIDAVLCSDYLSGLLTAPLVQGLKHLCAKRHLLLTVDAQGELDKYVGVDLVRCNNDEAAAYLGYRLQTEDDYRRGLAELLDRLRPRLLVVTRGRDGLSLQGEGQPYRYIPAHGVEAADTTGAGDTFIAAMTLSLSAGLQPVAAAQLANYAAGLVVRRLGNAVVTPEELAAGIEVMDDRRPTTDDRE